MRTLEMLIDRHEAGWPQVRSWIDGAGNGLEILLSDRTCAVEVLGHDPLGPGRRGLGDGRPPRGRRVLGGGGPLMTGDLANWNGLGARPVCRAVAGLSVIAHDAAGGVFALDGGALGPGRNAVHYPDTLRWIEVHRGYSTFLEWLCVGDIAGFSARVRWDVWQEDVAAAGPDRAFAASPPRWTVEGKHSGRSDLRPVPMSGLFRLQREVSRQMHAVTS